MNNMKIMVRTAVAVFFPELPLLVALLAGLWFANSAVV